jgi:hypothetical protein
VPQPRFSDIRRFCSIDEWEELGRVRGGTGDHWRYRKVLTDGTVLRTRASHGDEQIADPNLWRRIWREQLGLESEERFWEALRTGDPVQRTAQAPAPPTGPSIPVWIVQGLLRAGVREEQIREFDAAEAQRRLEDFWSQSPGAE